MKKIILGVVIGFFLTVSIHAIKVWTFHESLSNPSGGDWCGYGLRGKWTDRFYWDSKEWNFQASWLCDSYLK